MDAPPCHNLAPSPASSTRGARLTDANALNEVELLADSVMHNGGILRGYNVVKWIPEVTVLKLPVGDRIAATAADFDRLVEAFFEELERRFVA